MRYFITVYWLAVIFWFVWIVSASSAEAAPYYRAEASYYRLFGNRTSCGVIMSDRAWHVAALKKRYAKCGMKVRICHRNRYCVNVRVKDRGAWRSDNRVWDLTPRVKRALRCGDLCHVKYRMGWR